jgi:enoyl-CoA hydratase/carnithine racemase
LSEPVLLIEDLGPVRRLTMNRPGSLNALDRELVGAMSATLDDAARDAG